VRNSAGAVGYAPTNYVEVFASEMVAAAAPEGDGGWGGVPGAGPMQTIPEALANSSEEEGETEAETEDELPPGGCSASAFPPILDLIGFFNSSAPLLMRPGGSDRLKQQSLVSD
jgi:hypothetical protein